MIPALIWKEDQWIDEKKQDIININNFLRREKKVEKKKPQGKWSFSRVFATFMVFIEFRL